MNSLDIVILIILLVSFVYSLFRGFVREVFSLLALIVGFLAAVRLYHFPAALLGKTLDNPIIAGVLGFILTFIAVSVAISLMGRLVRKFVATIKLESIDRMLGALFGLVKGTFLVIILILMLITVLPPGHSLLAGSRLSPYFMALGDLSLRMIPGDMRVTVRKKREDLTPYWNQPPERQNDNGEGTAI
ncbi:MAG: CvpA family protein [Deltaproteobacteria bacterium]|nr:CvpA family protein [Deltaproteobacteria bacterium]